MSDRGFQIRNQYDVHFITCAVVEWVDVFTRKIYADILLHSFLKHQKTFNLKLTQNHFKMN
jgi:hypothetical protein